MVAGRRDCSSIQRAQPLEAESRAVRQVRHIGYVIV